MRREPANFPRQHEKSSNCFLFFIVGLIEPYLRNVLNRQTRRYRPDVGWYCM